MVGVRNCVSDLLPCVRIVVTRVHVNQTFKPICCLAVPLEDFADTNHGEAIKSTDRMEHPAQNPDIDSRIDIK